MQRTISDNVIKFLKVIIDMINLTHGTPSYREAVNLEGIDQIFNGLSDLDGTLIFIKSSARYLSPFVSFSRLRPLRVYLMRNELYIATGVQLNGDVCAVHRSRSDGTFWRRPASVLRCIAEASPPYINTPANSSSTNVQIPLSYWSWRR